MREKADFLDPVRQTGPTQNRQPNCPGDPQLAMFDLGTLSAADSERLSDHIAVCSRCSTLLAEHHLRETRLVAAMLIPGDRLVTEPEFVTARQRLLDEPETTAPGHLAVAQRNGILPREN